MGTNHEGVNFGRRLPPTGGQFSTLNNREGGLIDLDQVLKQAAIRIDHGTAQLVQQEPGTLATAEPELGLELQGGDTVRVAGVVSRIRSIEVQGFLSH